MLKKYFSLLFILSVVSTLSYAVIDIKEYLHTQGINPPYNSDLRSYIQTAIDTDDVRFSGIGSINSPLVYPTTATLKIPEGRKVVIAAEAVCPH